MIQNSEAKFDKYKAILYSLIGFLIGFFYFATEFANKYFLLISVLFILIILFWYCRKKYTVTESLLIIMISVLPFSYVNFFGDYHFFGWFYIICLIFFVYQIYVWIKHVTDNAPEKKIQSLFNNIKLLFKRSIPFYIALISLIMIPLSLIPLLISDSVVLGLPNFIQYVFFFATLSLGIIIDKKISKTNYYFIIDIFILIGVICAILLFIQYGLYTLFKITLWDILITNNGKRISCLLLFPDFSSNSLLLSCGAFLAILRFKVKNINLIYFIIIIIALALSGTRTGLFSLIIILAIYLFFNSKGLEKKLIYTSSVAILFILLLFIMSKVRTVDNILQLILDSSGRGFLINKSIEYASRHLWLGTGFDITPILLDHNILVHFYPLLLLNMTGIFYSLLVFSLFALIIIHAKKTKNKYCFWLIIMVLICGAFIPDIISNRYVYVIILLNFLYKSEEKTSKGKELEQKELIKNAD